MEGLDWFLDQTYGYDKVMILLILKIWVPLSFYVLCMYTHVRRAPRALHTCVLAHLVHNQSTSEKTVVLVL